MGKKITDPKLIAELNAQVRSTGVSNVDTSFLTKPPMSKVEGSARALLQGGTFGFGDEAAAAVATGLEKLTGSPRPTSAIFRDIVEQERGRLAQFQKERPVLATGTEIAGGVLGGLGAVKAVKEAAPALVETAAVRTPSFLKPVAAGAGGGLIFGAGKAGTGETVEGALSGALTGAVAGPLAHVLINKIGIGGTRILLKKLTSGPRTQAERLIKQAMVDSGFTREQAEAELRRLGPDAIVADLGGQLRNLARTASAQPTGTARATAEKFLNARDLKQQNQLWGLTQKLTGSRGKVVNTLRQLETAQRQAARPLYKQAYQNPIPQTQVLRDALDLSDVKSALTLGRKLVEAETGRKAVTKAMTGGKITRFPDMRQWDMIQRGLRRKALRLQRAGDRDQARALFQLRGKVLSELDQANPDFARARATYAQSEGVKEALEQGQRFLKLDSEVLEDYLEGLTESERQAFTIGATKAIGNEILKPAASRDVTRIGLFQSPLIRERLSLAIGEGRASKLLDTAQNLGQMRQTRNTLLERSPTADILAGSQQAQVGSLIGGAAQAATGDVVGGARQAAAAFRPQRTIRPDVAAQLTQLLFKPNPVLNRLTPSPVQGPQNLGLLLPFISGGQATALTR